MANKRVLVIDDEAAIRAVIQGCLEDVAEWDVLTAETGYEGLILAEQENPDAILLDISMPELSGEETFQQLQNNPATRSIPVVFLTAKALPEEKERFLQLGVIGLIVKPFDPMTLAEHVAEQLGWEL